MLHIRALFVSTYVISRVADPEPSSIIRLHAQITNQSLPMFVQTVQTKAEAPLSIKCLTKSTVPKSFIPPDVVQVSPSGREIRCLLL